MQQNLQYLFFEKLRYLFLYIIQIQIKNPRYHRNRIFIEISYFILRSSAFYDFSGSETQLANNLY